MARIVGLHHIVAVYEGSDADKTRALYADLEEKGPRGRLAAFLMRAQKSSARAKVYRGGNSRGSYRGQAYDTKAWAITSLTEILPETGLEWGWREDPAAEYHRWVLYVELPNGQVSFHMAVRGEGPDAPRDFDGARGASPGRICAFAASLLA